MLMRADGMRLALAVLLAIGAAITVGVVAAGREANLAWDDADYLRRGLRLARLSEAGPVTGLAAFLEERPKPPLYVGLIGLVSECVGREHLALVIGASVAIPLLLLLVGSALVAARFFGARAAVPTVLAILASPLTLSLAGSLMVETLLAVTVGASLVATACFFARPRTGQASVLGVVLGFSALTKTTVALLMPGAWLAFLVLAWKRRETLRGWSPWVALVAAMLVVAGPWYARHGRAALEFSINAAAYDVQALGHARATPYFERLHSLGADLVGWVPLAILGVGAIAAGLSVQRGRLGLEQPARDFVVLTLSAAAVALFLAMIVRRYDSRFLAPLWPAVAATIVGLASRAFSSHPRAVEVGLVAGLAVGASLSAHRWLEEPGTSTPWDFAATIDELVEAHGVRRLATIGDSRDWNVCKLGLVNELRAAPDSCGVMFDLSRLASAGLSERLKRFDAVVVLRPEALDATWLASAPGLNRAAGVARACLRDAGFRLVDSGTPASVEIYLAPGRPGHETDFSPARG